MTIWEWANSFEHLARAAGDEQRVRLTEIHAQAYPHRQTDPDRMLALLEEGRRLALRLQEPWWVLFFEHWQLETFIYYKDDYRQVIDLAVRATLELRKPIFEGYPLRFGIYCNLVAAYLCVDPRGYEQAIREAIEYLQDALCPDGSDRYLILARRHWFAFELGRLEEAHALALEELAMADSDPERHTARHHEADTYKALCWIAYNQGDFVRLQEYATTGEERARKIRYTYELAQFLLWQAFSLRRQGETERSKRLCREGRLKMKGLRQPPGESYYDALAAYHEVGQEWADAWEIREEELRTTLGKGQLAYECQVRLKRVRLLARMGRPTELQTEAEAMRGAAARLRAPQWYLGELAKVTG